MTRAIPRIKGSSRYFHRCYASNIYNGLRSVPTIRQSLSSIDLDGFRKNAFIPETPVLISNGSTSEPALPAADKWFTVRQDLNGRIVEPAEQELSLGYLLPFAGTILPYELYSRSTKQHDDNEKHSTETDTHNVASALGEVMKASPDSTFHRFNAPLDLFLHASTLPSSSRPRLYIAQAQIADLPAQLKADLPTPTLVKEAGKGDVYDTNVWMGIPPTYTPLHKDPNPNLFVQLTGKKEVRLFPARVGMDIFRNVQMEIGQNGLSAFRGNEMMEGPERDLLERAVWGTRLSKSANEEGLEAVLGPGMALFIPKGWWHSIKSVGEGINASVNWWFR